MSRPGETDVGRITVEFTVANYRDVQKAEEGSLRPDEVRQVRLNGIVNTGATRLVLPESVANALGLPLAGTFNVRYADQRTAKRARVRDAYVTLNGRQADFTAIVEPNRVNALIGAIVMEELDFLVDCTTQTLLPRDPNQFIAEVE